MASLLVRVCCLLACATALADEGEGTIVWARRGRTRLHCTAAGARLPGEGRRAPHSNFPLKSDGGPTPPTATARYDLTWWRDGEPLPQKGETLKTDKPGRYRCGVRTALGVVLGTEQHVKTPSLEKRFAQEPEGTSAAVGQPAVLRCRIKSSPPANITWLRDHQPLHLHDRYYVLSSGDLVITAVTEDDSGSYSCNASNALANKTRGSRSASLAVTSELVSGEPAFLVDDQRGDVRLRVGEELLLPCLVTGSPRPEVEWQWSREQGGRESAPVSSGPVLRVASVAPRHAGFYTCAVRDHRHLSKSWKVEVMHMQPARIVMAPQSIHKPSASVVRFDCQAEGVPAPVVTWYKNGVPLLLDGRLKVSQDPSTKVIRMQLVIGGAHPSDSGVYQCFAQSAGTEAATAWATLTVVGGSLPGPTDVRCSPLGLRSVRLQWNPVPVPPHNETAVVERPVDANGNPKKPVVPAMYYTVHFVPADCAGACKEQTKPAAAASAARMDVELEREATRYQFYVRAYYSKDASNPSHKVICQGQGVPVLVRKQGERARVEWAEAAARLARGTRWLLQYRPRLAAAVTDVALEPGTNQYLLPVTSEEDYEVRLLASTGDDFLSQNLSALAWTSTRDALANGGSSSDNSDGEQKVVSVVPSGLTASGQWARALRVSWRCDLCENSTSVYSFVLCYKRSDPLDWSKEHCKDSVNNELVVEPLDPGTLYEFRVQALLQRQHGAAGTAGAVVASGGGPFSDPLLASTLHDESHKIKHVSYNYTESGLHIWWTTFDTEPAPVDGAGNVTVYTVHYSQNLTRPLKHWMQLNVTGKTSIELSGLLSDLKTYVIVSCRSSGQEEHGPVMEVPPPFHSALLPPYALLGVIAGAVVCVICLLCCIVLCVWRRRKGARSNARTQRSGATADDDGTEMTVRSGAHVNGDGRGADEPLLNGHVHGAANPYAAKATPNGRYKRPAFEVFDLSRPVDDPDTTLDTILELDLSDVHHHARVQLHQQPEPSPRPERRTPPASKFPDDNMNSQTPLDFSQDAAPTLQPNG